MLRLEIDPVQLRKKLLIEAEDDISVEELIMKIEMVLKNKGKGILISCDKEGVLPFSQSLSDLHILSGERLIFLAI